MAAHLIVILFLFALGACVGSFLNVVVWRLPRGESLLAPPSHCPVCEHRLAWRDNIPVLGWIWLRGRCRYCFSPISAQYPAIEFLTGALFTFYYVMYFIKQYGPCPDWPEPRYLLIQEHWPIYALYMFAIASLLAASLIDLRLYWIPIEIPLLMAGLGVVYHTIFGATAHGWNAPGSLHLDSNGAAAPMTVGAGIGVLISIALLWSGALRRSFAHGYPQLEIEKMDEEELNRPSKLGALISRLIESFRRTLSNEQSEVMQQFQVTADAREKKLIEEFEKKQAAEPAPPLKQFTKREIRNEMRFEMLFLLVPLSAALVAFVLVKDVPAVSRAGQAMVGFRATSSFLGALFGGLVGALVVWVTRILGTLAFGREAMGLGDVHLMFGVGAIVGAGGATVAFFLAPFFGILIAIWMLLTGARRELPYGPYLSLATAFVMLFYCPIADYLRPGLYGLIAMTRSLLGL